MIEISLVKAVIAVIVTGAVAVSLVVLTAALAFILVLMTWWCLFDYPKIRIKGKQVEEPPTDESDDGDV